MSENWKVSSKKQKTILIVMIQLSVKFPTNSDIHALFSDPHIVEQMIIDHENDDNGDAIIFYNAQILFQEYNYEIRVGQKVNNRIDFIDFLEAH